MAEKEATVYIVDVGKSMGEMRNGRSMTDLEWAMQYVWDRITATVSIVASMRGYERAANCW
jgi:ATP-dependent DNA helicase 2 subunit 2